MSVQEHFSPLFFVHIPKTAGTSFRHALEEYFGSEFVCRDYGPQQNQTSLEVLSYVYENMDLYKFFQGFDGQYKVLTGHVPAGKYVSSIGVHRIISFVREPVKAVISHYRHHFSDGRFEGSLEDFYRDKR